MAISGVGTTFEKSTDGGATWDAVSEVKNIKGPTMTRDMLDTTSLSTSGGYRTFITGFRDAGQLSLTLNFTNAGYMAMKTDFESDSEVDYKITLPDIAATTLQFSGLVTECPLNIPEEVTTFDVTIKITGTVAVTST